MGVIIKKAVYELADIGLHNATIVEIEDLGLVETTNGMVDFLQLYFEVDQKDKEGKKIQVRQRYSKKLTPKSNFGKLLATLGIPAGDNFDSDDLIGLKCQIVVVHNTKDGNTYANVDSVIRVRKQGAVEQL